jgi:hypothetical protein
MNPPSNFEETKVRLSKPARRFNFKLAGALASVCLVTGLLLPYINYRPANHHRMPRGQFQADMRTMVAAVRYLFTPESDMEKNPAYFAGSTGPITQRALARPLETSDRSSNQTETNVASATSLPAPI